MSRKAPFDAVREFEVDGTSYKMADLMVLEDEGLCDLDNLPVSIRILLESVLRNVDGETITEEDVRSSSIRRKRRDVNIDTMA